MLDLWIFLYAAIVAAVVGVVWRINGFDLFHPVPLFLIYLFIQIGASNVLYTQFGLAGELALPLPQYESAYVRATAMAIVATVLVLVGMLAAQNRSVPLGRETGYSGLRLKALTVVVFAVGVIACLQLFRINGGFEQFIEGREQWRAVGMIGQGILTFPATVGLNLVALIHVGRAFSTEGNRAYQVGSLTLLILSIVPAVIFGFRSAIFLPMLQAALVIHYAGRGISAARLAWGAAAVIALFTTYGAYREVAPRGNLDAGAAATVIAERPDLVLGAISRSRGADVVATVVTRLDVTPDFDWGPDALKEMLTIWIPTQLWPSKPVSSLMRFTTYFFGSRLAETREDFRGYFSGISPTFVGETYWHLGYPGLVVFSLLWGFVGQVLYNTLKRYPRRVPVLVFYAVFWVSFVMSAEAIQGYANALVLAVGALLTTHLLLAGAPSTAQPVPE